MYSIKKERFNEAWTIKTMRVWDVDSIHEMCTSCNFYTRGNNGEYKELFDFVVEHAPTTNNMFWVARNILLHSEDDERTVEERLEHIFFCLENYAITTSYSAELGFEYDN